MEINIRKIVNENSCKPSKKVLQLKQRDFGTGGISRESN